MNKMRLMAFCFLLLTGCTHRSALDSPNAFMRPNRVVTKTVSAKPPTVNVHATFAYGNNPAVIKAYKAFSKSGKAATLQSSGFVTLPYDGYSHPIVTCEPLHLCVVQLEQGEHINNIDLGDSAHWLVSTARVGTEQAGSYQIAIKPKAYHLATDLVITTDKRTYNMGLVSQEGAYTHVTNFYYPQETLRQAIQAAHQQASLPTTHSVIDSSTKVDMDHLNFDYRWHGAPAWRPLQIFDDGNKTYIRLPAMAARLDLPVLYLLKQHTKQLINYRYKAPYYVIDALFQRAILVSGKGHHQERVLIENRHWAAR